MADDIKNVHNGPAEEKQYTFVKETIRPKKKNKLKKVLFTCGLAILFGVVSCIVFCLCLPLFSDYFEINSKQIIIGKGDELGNSNEKTASPETTSSVTETPLETVAATIAPTSTPKETSETEETEEGISEKIQSVSEKVNMSIVTITSVKSGYDIFDNPSEDMDSTCAVVVGESSKYFLLYVNQSRIDSTDNLLVTLSDHTVVEASLYNTFDELGIAIVAIKISDLTEEQKATLSVAEFDTSDSLEVGEEVIALGNPNGYMYSCAYGVISNEQYNAYITDNAVTIINTTIECNENGEGVIANTDGQIVGFITHQSSFTTKLNQDINTCYSMKTLEGIITKLVNQSDDIYFGIIGNDITAEISYLIDVDSGVYVTTVDGNSPAFNADIKKGDVITEINGIEITDMSVFNSVINNYYDKARVKVKLLRKQDSKWKEQTVYVDLTVVK